VHCRWQLQNAWQKCGSSLQGSLEPHLSSWLLCARTTGGYCRQHHSHLLFELLQLLMLLMSVELSLCSAGWAVPLLCAPCIAACAILHMYIGERALLRQQCPSRRECGPQQSRDRLPGPAVVASRHSAAHTVAKCTLLDFPVRPMPALGSTAPDTRPLGFPCSNFLPTKAGSRRLDRHSRVVGPYSRCSRYVQAIVSCSLVRQLAKQNSNHA
jgi:hypothetical protein